MNISKTGEGNTNGVDTPLTKVYIRLLRPQTVLKAKMEYFIRGHRVPKTVCRIKISKL